MNFTESLTELLRPELFPKLPKQLLGLLNIPCHSVATMTAVKRFQLQQTNLSKLWWKRINHIRSNTEFTKLSTESRTPQFCGSGLNLQQCHQVINDLNLRSNITAHSHWQLPQRNTEKLDVLVQYFTVNDSILYDFSPQKEHCSRDKGLFSVWCRFRSCLSDEVHACLLPLDIFLSPVHKWRAFIMR